MNNDKWSAAEKKIARRAFDAALEREFAALIVSVKEKAAALATSEGAWDMHHYLSDQLREINRKYDYRYSVLIMIFGRLLREKWITEQDLDGLAVEKIEAIRHIATY